MDDRAKRQPRRTVRSALVIVAAAGCAVAPMSPGAVERWYSTGLYPQAQRAITPMTNLVPFALLDLLVLAAGVFVASAGVVAVRSYRRTRRLQSLGATARRVATAAAVVYLVFLLLWGFNYRRVAMEQRLELTGEQVTSERVVALGLEAAARLNALHGTAHDAGWTQEPWREGTLPDAFAAVQPLLSDAPPAVPGRLKKSLFGFYFRWAGIDGMVDPFALEVIGNPDLLPWERPFVAAHEWAHLAGYAHEAEANFVGWLTCLRGDDAVQYSGWLYLYWQVAGEVPRPAGARLANALAPGPRADVQAIVDRLRRGQLPFLRTASWTVYDHYLRANRVQEGVRSYGEVINLILTARFADGWTPIRRGLDRSSR